jgi:hypothetical protein
MDMNTRVTLDPLYLIIDNSLAMVREALQEFTTINLDSETDPRTFFGSDIDIDRVSQILRDLTEPDSRFLPAIEIRSGSEINRARGAFAGERYTIYLSREFLEQNRHSTSVLVNVLLEEIGHAIDFHLNASDTPGDEGEIFSALVRGEFLNPATLQRLREEDDTVTVSLDNRIVQLEQAAFGVNPAFDLIGLTRLRNDPRFAGIDGSGFSVAVLDTGLDAGHPFISPNFRAFVDFVEGRNGAYDSGTHGTHVAGTVGARDENIGVAPDVGLIGVRAIGAFTALQNSLQWVLDNRARYNIIAVNMSLGENSFLTDNAQINGRGGVFVAINDLIRRLENAGVTVVSAGGNSYFTEQRPGVAFPAISSTINVGAVWQDSSNSNIQFRSGAADFTTGADRITSFSQRLDDPNNIFDSLFAPGAFITSTVPGGGLDGSAGTSQASPHVAGAVALMQEAALQFAGRQLSPAEIVEIMRSTADTIFDGDDENDNVQNTNTSYRRLNIYNAISEIKRRSEGTAPPPPGGGAGDPNGTIAGAYLGPIVDGFLTDPIIGSIGTDGGTTRVGNKDVDIIRFEVQVPGTVTLELASRPDAPADFDTLLRLFDASGNELAFDDDGGAGNFSRLAVRLAPGIYYAGISGYNNRNYNPNVAGSGVEALTGNYSLQFNIEDTDFNGLLPNAVEIVLGTDIDPYDFKNGFIGADNGRPVGTADVDLFKVIVPDNGKLLIDIDTPFNNGEYVDSYLRIFDGNGEPIAFSDDALSTDKDGSPTEFTDSRFPDLVFEDPADRRFFQGHRTDSFIAGTVRRGEVYYIGVSDYLNQNYNTRNLNNRSTRGPGGLYNLDVRFQNNDRNGSIAQAVSTLPLPITAQPGVIGIDTDPRTGQGSEVGDLDIDFVKIRSATAGILEIDIDSYENAPSVTRPVDTVLSIFDERGLLLARNDDTNNQDPLLQYRIQANTDYFVSVSGYGNDNFDPRALGSGSPGDTGEYIFNSRLLPAARFGTLSNDILSSSIVQSNAGTISTGRPVSGNIGKDNDFVIGAADIDIYRFTATNSGTLRVRTNTYEAFSADTFLRVFNSSGQQIAANDNANNTDLGSYVEIPVAAGEQYYIGVNGSGPRSANYDPITGNGAAPGSEGNYSLSLSPGLSSSDLLSKLNTGFTRFQNTGVPGTYLFAGPAETASIRQNFPGFREEGLAFQAAVEPDDDLLPFVRFQNTAVPGTYLFAGPMEAANIRQNFPGFKEEGVAFYALDSSRNLGTQFYRFQNTAVPGTYLFAGPAERDNILANFPSFRLEGEAFEMVG